MFLVLILFFLILFLLYKLKNLEKFELHKENTIYTLWMSKHPMSKERKNALKSLRKTSECNVVLITLKDVKKYEIPSNPIHPAFEYLSDIHKADYFRCYMMHNYGGGYSDLKKTTGSWKKSFDKLRNNKDIWALGLNADHDWSFALPDNLSEEERKNIEKDVSKMIGVGYFIYKKNTPLTKEWIIELHRVLDENYDLLKKHPAKYPRESSAGLKVPEWEREYKKIKVNENKTKYPIFWNRILAQINCPIQHKYLKHISTGLPHPDPGNYKALNSI
jgi:hypothetical protein